jgi:lipopolysaccharide kinase (Kdo/WaaP) family protein
MLGLLDRVGKWSYGDWVNGPGVTVIQKPSTRLAVVYRPEPEGKPYFVKVSQFIRTRKRIRSLYRPSDSHKEWAGSLAAWGKGLPTPEPFCLGERRKWGMLEETYFIAEAVEGAFPSLNLFHSPPSETVPADWTATRREFLRQFGQLVRRVQDSGIVHRQLGPLNILVRVDPRDALHLAFTDNKHLTVCESATDERRLLNLVRTYYQWLAYLPGDEMRLPDILRFLRSYRMEGDASDKALFREVMAEVYRQADRYAHRNMVPPPCKD